MGDLEKSDEITYVETDNTNIENTSSLMDPSIVEEWVDSLTLINNSYEEEIKNLLQSHISNIHEKLQEVSKTIQSEQQFILERELLKSKLEEKIEKFDNLFNVSLDGGGRVFKLNVRGTKMEIQQATLCAIENSFLADMFGRNAENLVEDEDGYIFIPQKPGHFELLIDYLDVYRYDENVEFPTVHKEEMSRFKSMCKHFGIEAEVEKYNNSEVLQNSYETMSNVSNSIRLKGKKRDSDYLVSATGFDTNGSIHVVIWNIRGYKEEGFLGTLSNTNTGYGWVLRNGIVYRDNDSYTGKGRGKVNNVVDELTIIVNVEQGQIYMIGNNIMDSVSMTIYDSENYKLCIEDCKDVEVNVATISIDRSCLIENETEKNIYNIW